MKVQEAIAAIQKDPTSIDRVMDSLTEEIVFKKGQKVHVNHGIWAGNDATVVGEATNGYVNIKSADGSEMPLPSIFLVAK
jgi:hypothetical protein